jgi:hypothetical protein
VELLAAVLLHVPGAIQKPIADFESSLENGPIVDGTIV